jgi:hypothetical protein
MPESTPPNNPVPVPPQQMIDALIRIDLLGMPDDTVYTALQSGLAARRWITTLTADDGQLLPLPSGTYSGRTSESVDDLSQKIHDWIMREIWGQGALVLVNELAAWSIAGDR